MVDPIEIARQWFKAIEDHDIEGAVALLGSDVDFQAPGGSFKGSDAVRPFVQGYVESFPDARFDVSSIISSGDRAFAEATYIGTNTGAMPTPAGEMPPTGKPVSLPFGTAFLIRDDRIAELHAYWDQMAFLGQLGLVPEGMPGS